MNKHNPQFRIWRPRENISIKYREDWDLNLPDKDYFMTAFKFRPFKRIPNEKEYGVYFIAKMHTAETTEGGYGNFIIPLYIGCSGNIRQRLQNHRTTKDWWNDADFIWICYYQSREDALKVEEMLINRTRPVHNKQVVREKPKKKEIGFQVVNNLHELANASFCTDIYHKITVMSDEV